MISTEPGSKNLTRVKEVPKSLEDLALFYLKDGEHSLAEAPDAVFESFVTKYVDVTYEDNFESPVWSPDQRLDALQQIGILGLVPELYREGANDND